jgi:hypothetical protein
MLGIRYNTSTKYNSVKHTNNNNYFNNNGGNSTLKKKYAHKFSTVSSNKNFSINGFNNNYYIGNENSQLRRSGVVEPNDKYYNTPYKNVNNSNLCLTNTSQGDFKTSVKSYHALRQTRIVGTEIKADPTISFDRYKCKLNFDSSYNKIFRSENKDSSSKIEQNKCVNKHTNIFYGVANGVSNEFIFSKPLTSIETCLLNVTINNILVSNYTITSNSIIFDTVPPQFAIIFVDKIYNKHDYINDLTNNQHINCNKNNINNINNINNHKCNITKDINLFNANVPSYELYLLKKKQGCKYNPPDAKIIAC